MKIKEKLFFAGSRSSIKINVCGKKKLLFSSKNDSEKQKKKQKEKSLPFAVKIYYFFLMQQFLFIVSVHAQLQMIFLFGLNEERKKATKQEKSNHAFWDQLSLLSVRQSIKNIAKNFKL